ncbi:GNAT family N-acetyltransferase [Streptomyces orinoci]|uniref:GNAT family N-acetyltransferase n=1 Tax=Streptomyces orinoci TaxID=67339 RepID=A0ABV3K0K6_STRON
MDETLANDTLDVPALHESPQQVRDWLAAWHTTGLRRNGRFPGMVRARRVGTDWHVGRLCVAADLRGQGLGRWLLRTAESAAAPDCTSAVLFTGARTTANLALYGSEGYRPVPHDEPEGVTRLVKTLRP